MSVLRDQPMDVIAVRLPKPLNRRLAGLAKTNRRSKSAVIRDVLESHVSRSEARTGTASLELVKDLVGCLHGGPTDLASNKKHMEGYGR